MSSLWGVAAVLLAAIGSPAQTTTSATHHLDTEAVARLLEEPVCLESFSSSRPTWRVQDFPVTSKGITLSGELYLPLGDGEWPAVILVPGGFNETELIMRAPRYDAPRLAHCGIAAVVYYKRGTGPSGGFFGDGTYDLWIDDVGSIARALARHPSVDRARIGAIGGSSGGLVASVAAARYPEISFVVNKSGPIVSMEEEADFNIEYALRSAGNADSVVDKVLPVWKRHHAAWAAADTSALEAVAAQIRDLRRTVDPDLLPTPYEGVFMDSSLAFLWPTLRSFGRDFLSDLTPMHAKWLSVYGEKDPIVPVASCVKNIDALMGSSGNNEYAVIVLPGVDHSFGTPGTTDQVPVLRIVVNWLAENVARE